MCCIKFNWLLNIRIEVNLKYIFYKWKDKNNWLKMFALSFNLLLLHLLNIFNFPRQEKYTSIVQQMQYSYKEFNQLNHPYGYGNWRFLRFQLIRQICYFFVWKWNQNWYLYHLSAMYIFGLSLNLKIKLKIGFYYLLMNHFLKMYRC